jgi:hypothetical protein
MIQTRKPFNLNGFLVCKANIKRHLICRKAVLDIF